MNSSESKKKCTYTLTQEATLQFPEGGEQSNPTANHLAERIKNCTSAATPRTAEENHRTRDASWLRSPVISYPIIIFFILFFNLQSSISHRDQTKKHHCVSFVSRNLKLYYLHVLFCLPLRHSTSPHNFSEIIVVSFQVRS